MGWKCFHWEKKANAASALTSSSSSSSSAVGTSTALPTSRVSTPLTALLKSLVPVWNKINLKFSGPKSFVPKELRGCWVRLIHTLMSELSLHNANNENWEDGETMEKKLRLSLEKSFVLHVCLSKIGKVDWDQNFFLLIPLQFLLCSNNLKDWQCKCKMKQMVSCYINSA